MEHQTTPNTDFLKLNLAVVTREFRGLPRTSVKERYPLAAKSQNMIKVA